MRFTNVFALAGLAATALASGSTITTAIGKIGNATIALNKTVAAWNGNLLGTPPIVVRSTQLLLEIKNGTKVAEASAALSTNEALQVASATLQLAGYVEATLNTIVKAKAKFDRLLLSPTILVTLKLQKEATDEFSSAVVAKVPTDLQDTAKTLIAGIDKNFDTAIGAYV